MPELPNTAPMIADESRSEEEDRSRHFLTLLGAFLAANLSSGVASAFAGGGWGTAAIDVFSGLFVLQTWRASDARRVSETRLASCAVIASLSPLVHLHSAGETQQAALLAVVVVSLPFFLGTSRYFLPVLILCLTGWLIAASAADLPSVMSGLGLLSLSAIASLWHRIKVRKLHEQGQIRRRNELERVEASKHQLLAVQASGNGYWYWDLKTNGIRLSESWGNMLAYRSPTN